MIRFLTFFCALLGILTTSAFAADLAPIVIEDNSSVCRQGASCREVMLPDGAKTSERVFGLEGLSNVGRVTPVIYRGAQPQPEGYATLKRMGIKTVINLRGHSEKDAVEKAGMRSIEVPFSVLKDVDIAKVNKVIEMMTDPNSQPLYVHCRQGQDRTGIIIAAYRMKIEGWSFKDAEAEMQAFGFNDMWRELKEFIREYAKGIGR